MKEVVDNIGKGLLVERTVSVVVSAQALAVLSHTSYTPEEFLEWVLNKRKISFGGANVIEFLESKGRKE